MSKARELKATERDTTITPRQLRAAGYIPATFYGRNIEPQCFQVRTHEFQQLYTQGIREFQLSGFINGPVRANETQVDAVSRQPLSIQFFSLDGNTAPKADKGEKAKGKKAGKAAVAVASGTEAALSGV